MASPADFTKPSKRDWPEDFDMKNGNYLSRCYRCDKTFFGHKHRIECKVCAQKESN